MSRKSAYTISGKDNGIRIDSRLLEERMQKAVEGGYRNLIVEAFGQHGIGGRLWKAGNEKVYIKVAGAPGQRLGSLAYPNTTIEIMGPVSEDVGWLNAGAEIIVHGNAGNGTANAMAQGKIYIAGNTGSRTMTMTKRNPRFEPPELWVLGSVGDYFGEFMAGGIAVICGWKAQSPENVLGYRPLVGMVSGTVYVRGQFQGYSQADAIEAEITDDEWDWLESNLKVYLQKIDRQELISSLSVRKDWKKIRAKGPQEKGVSGRMSMSEFRRGVWDAELGKGGLIGDLSDMDMSPIPLITTADLRRYVPVWENDVYMAPCQATCPSGIPVQERWRLVREGRIDEAVDMALAYSPFPATVCGYLCPNPCMGACTKGDSGMLPVDITLLGKASINAKTPNLPELSGKRVAVIGGGPAGISAAWQLRLAGHEAVIFDNAKEIGGKITSVIPGSRIPKEVVSKELERVREVVGHVQAANITKKDFEKIVSEYDFVIIATGAQKPRILPIPGRERMITSLDFLLKSKIDAIRPGENVVVIGAGNVGCDVATEAKRLGAETVTLIDVQKPAAFGKEREEAEHAGAVFRWPCFTSEITAEGVKLTTGEVIPADTVVVSIGDTADLEFLPERIRVEKGLVTVNDVFQTTDSRVFAIGDIVKAGLITDAIGAGHISAKAINDIIGGQRPRSDTRRMIDKSRVKLEYFDPRILDYGDTDKCGSECASCGKCRDCGICVAVCPEAAISRKQTGFNDFEYRVNPDRCIACGFCAGACPCGIWNMTVNSPLE